jgi:hypothetical protein
LRLDRGVEMVPGARLTSSTMRVHRHRMVCVVVQCSVMRTSLANGNGHNMDNQ